MNNNEDIFKAEAKYHEEMVDKWSLIVDETLPENERTTQSILLENLQRDINHYKGMPDGTVKVPAKLISEYIVNHFPNTFAYNNFNIVPMAGPIGFAHIKEERSIQEAKSRKINGIAGYALFKDLDSDDYDKRSKATKDLFSSLTKYFEIGLDLQLLNDVNIACSATDSVFELDKVKDISIDNIDYIVASGSLALSAVGVLNYDEFVPHLSLIGNYKGVPIYHNSKGKETYLTFVDKDDFVYSPFNLLTVMSSYEDPNDKDTEFFNPNKKLDKSKIYYSTRTRYSLNHAPKDKFNSKVFYK